MRLSSSERDMVKPFDSNSDLEWACWSWELEEEDGKEEKPRKKV
jgi:hypothetical protein